MHPVISLVVKIFGDDVKLNLPSKGVLELSLDPANHPIEGIWFRKGKLLDIRA
jgi:hypothetical protein